MLISRVDSATQVFTDACLQTQLTLVTPRATGSTRDELNALREASLNSGLCAYCGKPVVDRAPRHTESCAKCGMKIDRMMQLKSRICSSNTGVDLPKQLLELYKDLQEVPPALRGSTGNVQDVIAALERQIVAYKNMRLELKHQWLSEAQAHEAERKRDEILKVLIACGMEPDDPATHKRVEELYYDS